MLNNFQYRLVLMLPDLTNLQLQLNISQDQLDDTRNEILSKDHSLASINHALSKCNKNFLNIVTIHLNGMKTGAFFNVVLNRNFIRVNDFLDVNDLKHQLNSTLMQLAEAKNQIMSKDNLLSSHNQGLVKCNNNYQNSIVHQLNGEKC